MSGVALVTMVRIPGEPEVLHAQADVIVAGGRDVQRAADDYRDEVARARRAWHGAASDAFAAHSRRLAAAADEFADDVISAAGPLHRYAEELAAAQRQVAEANSAVSSAGRARHWAVEDEDLEAAAQAARALQRAVGLQATAVARARDANEDASRQIEAIARRVRSVTFPKARPLLASPIGQGVDLSGLHAFFGLGPRPVSWEGRDNWQGHEAGGPAPQLSTDVQVLERQLRLARAFHPDDAEAYAGLLHQHTWSRRLPSARA